MTLPKTNPPKPGRPRLEFTKTELDQVAAMAGYGMTIEQISTILNVSVQTLYNHQELLESIKKGQAVAALNVTKTAYQIAVDDRNPIMTMFILKCRHGWKDRAEEPLTDAVKASLLAKLPMDKVTELLRSTNDTIDAGFVETPSSGSDQE